MNEQIKVILDGIISNKKTDPYLLDAAQKHRAELELKDALAEAEAAERVAAGQRALQLEQEREDRRLNLQHQQLMNRRADEAARLAPLLFQGVREPIVAVEPVEKREAPQPEVPESKGIDPDALRKIQRETAAELGLVLSLKAPEEK